MVSLHIRAARGELFPLHPSGESLVVGQLQMPNLRHLQAASEEKWNLSPENTSPPSASYEVFCENQGYIYIIYIYYMCIYIYIYIYIMFIYYI